MLSCYDSCDNLNAKNSALSLNEEIQMAGQIALDRQWRRSFHETKVTSVARKVSYKAVSM